jgi:rubrerythrin
MPMPMLTEDEWLEVYPLLTLDIKKIQSLREEYKIGIKEATDRLQSEGCEKYFEITGFRETNPNAIWHHRLAKYGPECPICGHLFRTSQASFCANCGAKPFWRIDGE